MWRIFIYFVVYILTAGCTNRQAEHSPPAGKNKYAHGFQIDKKEKITKLTVFNPWEKAENVSVNYYLLQKGIPLPDSLSSENMIRTPVERVICLSTTHIAFLDALAQTETIVGISGSQYVSHQELRKKMANGTIPDVGYGQNLNYEMIVNQQPDIVLLYGVGSEVTNYTQKLRELEIKVIMIAEYLEEKPLGKAEWIKLIATLFNKEHQAKSYFSKIENEYLELKQQVSNKNLKPKVLVGSPYKDTWWVPGGNSYMANLIADAGGNYLGKQNNSNESYVISFENALAWGSEADVWINMGNFSSKKEIIAANERFKNLKVFQQGKIYNNIKKLSQHGGNDFWESGTVNPHLILKDLIHIFYPGLNGHELIYYQEIE